MKRQQSVDIVIPVYQPDKKFSRLLQMLEKQTYPIRHIVVMNTERGFWNEEGYRGIRGLEVHHVTKEEFDHGGTRELGAWYSEADIMIFMTDDAVPADEYLVEHLVSALSMTGPNGEQAAAAYARQLPAKDCRYLERYTRQFNYPAAGCVKTAADLPELGIKTYFASNVCCAYNKEIFRKLEGFTRQTIFNEDMIYAAGAIKAGYAVVYEPEAKVIHSHNFTFAEQFRRNFDLAVSQADNPDIFDEVPSEGEGIRMVKQTAKHLIGTGHIWLLPSLVIGSGCKYMGYRLGKCYRRLPDKLILKCTSNRSYWERLWKKRGGKKT